MFYDNCDNFYSTDDWRDNWTTDLNYFEVSNDVYRAGNGSYHFRVLKQDYIENGNKRCELKSQVELGFEEYWFGWSFLLEDGFNGKIPSWMLAFQFHGHPDDGIRCPNGERSGVPGEPWRNPPQAFFIRQNETNGDYYFQFHINADEKECTYDIPEDYTLSGYFGDPIPIKFGEWMDFVLHINFKYDNTGFFQVWENDVLYVDEKNLTTTFNDVLGPYLKIGIYGDSTNLDDGTEIHGYFDEIRIADSNGDYNMVRTPKDISGGYRFSFYLTITFLILFVLS